MIEPSTLLAGGAVAAVAGLWSKIKSFFSFISSFVVITAHFESFNVATPVRIYLKKHYKTVPTGVSHFVAHYAQSVINNESLRVPFLLLHSTAVFYSREHRHILLVRYANNSELTVYAIRGTIDFKHFLNLALDFRQALDRNTQGPSNFRVHKVIGTEKGYAAANQRGEAVRRNSDSLEAAPSSENGSHSMPADYEVEESFRYKRSEYQSDAQYDPFSHLYYSPEVMKHIEQASSWMDMQDWYNERKIPWRRGWLLHGPGGTGKSSLARGVAIKLRIPIYHYHLGTLSDQEFLEEWENMHTPCVVLFEDFDSVFDKRQPLTEHKLLTFDTVLNQISGVNTTNGIFLIVTTNRIEKIDDALGISCDKGSVSTRPGRIDSVIYLGHISQENKYKMAQQVLRDWPSVIEEIVQSSGEVTPIQFMEMCIQKAFDQLEQPQSQPRLRVVGP